MYKIIIWSIFRRALPEKEETANGYSGEYHKGLVFSILIAMEYKQTIGMQNFKSKKYTQVHYFIYKNLKLKIYFKENI